MIVRQPLRAFAITFLAAFIGAASGVAGTKDAAPITCANGIYRLSPPGVAVAVYMTLTNTTNGPVTLVGATSEISDRVEIHRSGMSDGMMTMEQLDKLLIAPQAAATLKPGGLHLMVFAPKKPVKEGDSVTFTLKLSDGRSGTCITKAGKNA